MGPSPPTSTCVYITSFTVGHNIDKHIITFLCAILQSDQSCNIILQWEQVRYRHHTSIPDPHAACLGLALPDYKLAMVVRTVKALIKVPLKIITICKGALFGAQKIT